MAENKRSKNSDFIIQGSILAAASIISRIIGMIYRIPMTNILTDTGNGFYSVAYEVYNIALLLSSYSLPLAVSKLVATRVSRGERRNAWMVFKCAMLFALAVGIVFSVLLYLGAGFITGSIMNSPMSVYALQVLAPALFILAVMGVIRGYFQGLGTMVPTAASQIVEQIVNAIVSVTAASWLYKKGLEAVAESATADELLPYGYGAAGGTLGTSMGALAALLFLAFVLFSYRKVLRKQMHRDKTRRTDEPREIYRLLIITIVPVALSTLIYNLSTSVDQGIFNAVLKGKGYTLEEYSSLWGIFSGKYKLLVNVPVAIASAVSSSVIPGLTIAVRNKAHTDVSEKINTAIRFTMVITIPCAVGLAVLAEPVLRLLFTDVSQTAIRLMQTGSIAVVFYSLSTLTNGILQGINRMRVPLTNAVISLVTHIIVLFILLQYFELGIYAQLIAFILFGLMMCVLNAFGISRNIDYVQEVKRTFVIPSCASLIMGIVTFGLYTLLAGLIGFRVAVVIAIGVAVVLYAVLLLVMKGFTRAELLSMPKGDLIVRVVEKCHLM